MRTTQLPSSPRCLACNKLTDAASNLEGVSPTSGDINICFYCGYVAAFDDDLALRDLNDEEILFVAGNKEILAYQEARRILTGTSGKI